MSKFETAEKICPFMSNGEVKVNCNEECVLYRPNAQKNFACPLRELPTIAWNTSQRTRKIVTPEDNQYK